MTTIGVLGAGRMGRPIIDALVRDGHDVLVWDPLAVRLSGLPAASSERDVVERADVLVTVLPGSPEVDATASRAVEQLRAGTLWLDLSSSDPRLIQRLAERARHRGIATVGAPMAGGPAAAANGTLAFFVGGDADNVERVRPVLAILGERIDHVGPDVGDGYTAKLLANLLWFGQLIAVSEALLLGQELGISPSKLRTTFGASAGGSVFIDEYLDSLLDGDYAETFGLDRVVEELTVVSELAASASVPFELSNHVTRIHREALERFGAVPGEMLAAKLLEERAGRTLRR